jgi:hypothetical protein
MSYRFLGRSTFRNTACVGAAVLAALFVFDNVAGAQEVLLAEFTGGVNSGGGGFTATDNSNLFAGIGIGLVYVDPTLGFQNSFSSCLGCTTNFGNGVAQQTVVFNAQNSPTFSTFASLLTGHTNDLLATFAVIFDNSGQPRIGSGSGTQIESQLSTLFTPNVVTSVDQIEEQVSDLQYSYTYSPSQSSYSFSTSGRADYFIYGTPGPGFNGPYGSLAPPFTAPEIDPALAASGLTLLLGGLAVLRGWRKSG